MSYIGSTFSQQLVTPAVDYFNGNGVTTSFQLSRSVSSVSSIYVVVNNVPQNPRDAYGITANNQIVFTSPPSAGTNNIYVIYNSQVGQFVTPSPGTVTDSALAANAVTASALAPNSVTTNAIAPGAVTAVDLDVASLNGTGGMNIPAGTTAQRPATPAVGQTRYNTSLNVVEAWHPSGWIALSNVFQAAGGVESTVVSGGLTFRVHTFNSSANFTVQSGSATVEYLIVAGGGGGGCNAGAGGGAGGMLTGTVQVSPQTYTVIVGGGGAGGTTSNVETLADAGTNSSAFGQTAIGGGGGTNSGGPGGNGGSGGGAGDYGSGNRIGGSGTAGQGNKGGDGTIPGGATRTGAGGGGRGAAGQNSVSSSQAGNGGAGAEWPSGSGTFYAGGGGGAPHSGTRGTGGIGGGGNGDTGGSRDGGPGQTNRGGGGGAGSGGGFNGYAGGSGVVIIRYQI